jgi:hypothetical protein
MPPVNNIMVIGFIPPFDSPPPPPRRFALNTSISGRGGGALTTYNPEVEGVVEVKGVVGPEGPDRPLEEENLFLPVLLVEDRLERGEEGELLSTLGVKGGWEVFTMESSGRVDVDVDMDLERGWAFVDPAFWVESPSLT